MGGKWGPGGGGNEDRSGGPPAAVSFFAPRVLLPRPPLPHLSAGKPPSLRLVGKWWTFVTVCGFCISLSGRVSGEPLRET